MQVADNLPDNVQAQYIPKQRTVYVRNGMDETVTLSSALDSPSILFPFLKCLTLPYLRVLAVQQKQVCRLLRAALRHEIKKTFQGLSIFKYIAGVYHPPCV